MSEHLLGSLRQAAASALTAHEALCAACNRLAKVDSLPPHTAEDILLLKELIISRIYPLNVFGLLVRLDRASAIEVLLRRYVGRGVDPDTKFGGYQFELAGMLTDLVDVRGEAALRDLVQHHDFNPTVLEDSRVKASI